MNVLGERIIIFGDSLSHHGPDNGPEIWDVDQGSNRTSGQPGDLLASLLKEQGAQAVRVNARVGRSANNFWGRENTSALLTADAAFKPTKAVVILGTNDIGLNLGVDALKMAQIKSAYEQMGAEVWAIGPVIYADPALNARAEPVVAMMKVVFGPRFIDGRPLSVATGRARDGVHFQAGSAKETALLMADGLTSAKAASDWAPLLIGAAIAAAGWWYLRRRRAKRAGLGLIDIVNGKRHNGSTNELIRSGHRQVPCKSGLVNQARCWSKRS